MSKHEFAFGEAVYVFKEPSKYSENFYLYLEECLPMSGVIKSVAREENESGITYDYWAKASYDKDSYHESFWTKNTPFFKDKEDMKEFGRKVIQEQIEFLQGRLKRLDSY